MSIFVVFVLLGTVYDAWRGKKKPEVSEKPLNTGGQENIEIQQLENEAAKSNTTVELESSQPMAKEQETSEGLDQSGANKNVGEIGLNKEEDGQPGTFTLSPKSQVHFKLDEFYCSLDKLRTIWARTFILHMVTMCTVVILYQDQS